MAKNKRTLKFVCSQQRLKIKFRDFPELELESGHFPEFSIFNYNLRDSSRGLKDTARQRDPDRDPVSPERVTHPSTQLRGMQP